MAILRWYAEYILCHIIKHSLIITCMLDIIFLIFQKNSIMTLRDRVHIYLGYTRFPVFCVLNFRHKVVDVNALFCTVGFILIYLRISSKMSAETRYLSTLLDFSPFLTRAPGSRSPGTIVDTRVTPTTNWC